MVSDDALISSFLTGDVGAFEELVDKYHKPVFRMVMGLVGNESDAEELTQDIFVKIFFRLGGFKREAAFSTWLYTIVQNSVKTFRTKKRLSTVFSLDWMTDHDRFEIPDFSRSTHEKLEGKEMLEILNRALQKLSFKLRQILILKEVNELSYEEMAQILDCSIGTVKSRLSRAKEKLREIFPSLLEKESHEKDLIRA